MFEGAVVTALLIIALELRWLIELHRNGRKDEYTDKWHGDADNV